MFDNYIRFYASKLGHYNIYYPNTDIAFVSENIHQLKKATKYKTALPIKIVNDIYYPYICSNELANKWKLKHKIIWIPECKIEQL